MRAHIPNLASPHPLGTYLPALYQDDDFAQRFTEALDEVAAPVLGTLDNFEAYLDPPTSPEDFLEWLAAWVGVQIDATWPIERRRSLVASAADLYRLRGTAAGLAAHIAIFTGGEVEIAEPGAAGWSGTPGAAIPAGASTELFVRVRVPDPASVATARLETLVAAAKPAHVMHRVEIVKA
jgi:phage tail-like protein